MDYKYKYIKYKTLYLAAKQMNGGVWPAFLNENDVYLHKDFLNKPVINRIYIKFNGSNGIGKFEEYDIFKKSRIFNSHYLIPPEETKNLVLIDTEQLEKDSKKAIREKAQEIKDRMKERISRMSQKK